MAKFEESRHSHEVHEVGIPQGHGYVDQKYGKGNLSPMRGHVPMTDSGTMPSNSTAGSPGQPSGEYGSGPSGAGV